MEKMQKSSGEGNRPWDELIPDALALIFKKISFQEILTVVPAVCKSWRQAAMEPDCWQEIDIEDWCRSCKPENRDKMVKMLISRSGGYMRMLSVFGLTNDPIFAFIAGSADCLQTLRMPMSEVTDSIVTQVAPKLATITYLDISNCEKITSSSLEALGKHCKFLTRLSRNMHPQGTVGQSPKDDEASAIAKYMPRLKHLELAHGLLTDAGLEAILSMCKDLEHLDIRGCENVVIQDSLAEQCRNLKVFLGPVVYDIDSDSDSFHPRAAIDIFLGRGIYDLDYDSDSFHPRAAIDERLYIGYFGNYAFMSNSDDDY